MDLTSVIIAGVATVASVIGAIIAIIQARSAHSDKEASEAARNESREARDRAVLAAEQTSLDVKRSADAQEESNRIAQSTIVSPIPVWEIQHVKNSRWSAVNVGAATAYSATLTPALDNMIGFVRPDHDEPRIVDKNDSLSFLALETDQGPRLRVKILWQHSIGDGMISTTTELPVE